VLERYGNEIWRVTGVLDAHLKKVEGEWLVGDKCTYADLSFVPWYWLCPAIMGEGFEKVSCLFSFLNL
jgi:glutathione S-transferase